MKRFKFILALTFLLTPFVGCTQATPFSVSVEPVTIPGLGGVQSYAFGHDNGKVLIIGGRLDGLHQRQPFASFDVAGHNNKLIVIDLIAEQTWSAPLSSLSISIQEQLSSSNMEFYQEGNYLYCIGGYGYSGSLGDHTTYDKLTAIDVPGVINAVISGNVLTSYFRQITDPALQVTGGSLHKIHNKYYLMGGQKFLGRYNPHGPSHGPGFVQEYTNSIKIFTISDNGSTISLNHLNSYVDTMNLHRRDYNAVPQIMPNGDEGITMFSGVFQRVVDLPFLNCVNIDSSGFAVNNSFQQYYNHYHCPVLPVYSMKDNEMHTIFFGGIAQFYDDNGILVQDDDVPFVNTIARVTREGNGSMMEYKMPTEMPALLGAGAEFIPVQEFPKYENEVLDLDSLSNSKTHVGYIFGGIESSAPNIFFVNNGSQSNATSTLFKVFLAKGAILSDDELNEPSKGSLNVRVYPNPSNGFLKLDYNLKIESDVHLTISDLKGSILHQEKIGNQQPGSHFFEKDLRTIQDHPAYLIHLRTSYENYTQKLLVE